MKEYGTCRFCGQTAMVSVGETATQADIDEAATRECSCESARAYNNKCCDAEVCEENIKKVIGEENAVSQLLISCIPLIQDDVIVQVGVKIKAGVSARLGYNSKGNLVIQKTTTNVETEET